MSSAFVFVVLTLWLGTPASPPMLTAQETGASLPAQQTSNPQNPATSQETQAPKKPCPASPDSSSSKMADCKSARSKRKKHQHAQPVAPPGAGPTKTVVRNGSTADPTVAISPDLSDQETSRKLNSTDRLLASADANLKQIANRQLSASQEDTVKQIKVYMEQARTAAKNGEVQRAYTLANKANMLSADLVGPRQ
jgi:hypothetical protein